MADRIWIADTTVLEVDLDDLTTTSVAVLPADAPLIQSFRFPFYLNGFVYGMSTGTGTAFKINTTDLTVTRDAVATASNITDMEPGGGFLFVAQGTNLLKLSLDDFTNQSTSTIPSVSAMKYAGPYLYLCDEGANEVVVWDVTTDSEVTTIAIANGPRRITFDSGSGYLYVSSYRDIYQIDVTTNTVVATLNLSGTDITPYELVYVDGYLYHATEDTLRQIDVTGFSVAATLGVGLIISTIVSVAGQLYLMAASAPYANQIVKIDPVTLTVADSSASLGFYRELVVIPSVTTGWYIGTIAY